MSHFLGHREGGGLYNNFLNNLNPSNPRGIAGRVFGTFRQGIPEAIRTSRQAPGGIFGPSLVSGTSTGTSTGTTGATQGPVQGPTNTLNSTFQTTGGVGGLGDGGAGEPEFTPTTFNGVVYNTQAELEAAKIAFYTKQHDDFSKQLTQAYDSGLISFDQRKTALEQNRKDLSESKDAGFGAIQSSFSQASPDVVQSSQTDYQNRVTDQFNTAVGLLGQEGDDVTSETAFGDIARNTQAFNTVYANEQEANDLRLTNQEDESANALANARAGLTSAGSSSNTVNTGQLLQGLGDVYSQFNAQGFTKAQSDQLLSEGLIKSGVNQKDIPGILDYFYGTYYDQYRDAKGIA